MTRPVALTIVAMLFFACAKKEPRPGTRSLCTCSYLTDFDDTLQVDVDVCVADGKKVEQEAAYCAAQSAHNHVDKCSCRPSQTKCDASAKDACVPK